MFKLDLSYYDILENGDVINKRNGHKVKPQKNGKGYLRVGIGGKLLFVHRLVAEKYVPNPDNKPCVNHIDGNKLNNNASNLEWVTNLENRKHALDHRLHLCGEQCPYSKLKEENILFIREHDEYTDTELAKMFGVSRGAIESVRLNQTWKQLSRSRG